MKKPVRVVPAVLTEDPAALKTMLDQAAIFTDFVQIDIMDGKFVPSHSITWEQISGIRVNLKWEVHLMVEHPEKEFEHYQKAGAQRALFHFESTPSPAGVVAAARKMKLPVGLAVNPETRVSEILPLVDTVDSVLFLSVHPGYYGAKYLPEVLDKVVELRSARHNLVIGIDGGVKENNIVGIAASGVNEICVGSAVFMQTDPGAAYRHLTALVNSPQGRGNESGD